MEMENVSKHLENLYYWFENIKRVEVKWKFEGMKNVEN